jgi:hypothetical protein
VCGDDVEILVGADGRESVIGLRLSWRSEVSSTNVAGALVGWIGGCPGLPYLLGHDALQRYVLPVSPTKGTGLRESSSRLVGSWCFVVPIEQ